MKEFKVGDKVKWDSHGGGNWREKVGIVVKAFRPCAHKYGHIKRIAVEEFSGHIRMFDGGSFYNYTDTHYFVEVRKIGNRAKPRLYFPRPTTLQEVADADE